jgi:hypothetical protein
MIATCLTPTPGLTPADVLDTLQDLQRIHAPPGVDRSPMHWYTPGTPVIDALMDLHLESWRDFDTTLEWLFDIRPGVKVWRQLLTPVSTRTLGEVAAFIAESAPRLTLRHACLAGQECLTAGAFLALRAELLQARVPREWIAPSAPLDRVARRTVVPIVRLFARVAPGALPTPKYDSPVLMFLLRSFGFGLLILAEGWFLAFPPQWTLAFATYAAAVTLAAALIARWYPTRVHLGDLTTFRDLARRLAAGVVVRAEGAAA